MRYKITIEYDGTNYAGWQKQTNGVAIQDIVEKALEHVLKVPTKIWGSGRTDSGVHALGQVAHFDANTPITPSRLQFALNCCLPGDIKIVSVEKVKDDFHAQCSAIKKTYVYNAYVSQRLMPLKDRYAARILPSFDIDKVRLAAGKIVGEHDFAAFSANNKNPKIISTVRNIYRSDVISDGENVRFEIEGDGFLYKMVRRIVGTLVFIGRGQLPIDIIDKMFETGNKNLGGKTYPPRGLTLLRVDY